MSSTEAEDNNGSTLLEQIKVPAVIGNQIYLCLIFNYWGYFEGLAVGNFFPLVGSFKGAVSRRLTYFR